MLAAALLAFALLAGAVAWFAPQLPPLDRVTTYQPRQPLQVYTADGVEIAQFGAERRQFVPIAQIPLLLQQAVLAVWDRDILEFFLTGMMLFGMGLLGEYIGRVYQQVRHRPRYLVEVILERKD